jgi:hypothetical protein
MKLRFATRGDVPQSVEIGRVVHAESRFAGMPYDAAQAT